MILYRTGCVYHELTNDGKSRDRKELTDPAKLSKKFRWVAEIVVYGKRYRFRSTNRLNVQRWLDDMLEKHPTYELKRHF